MTPLVAKPLAIPVRPISGESLIGLIARATRLNVLGTNRVILEAGGIDLLHPGTVGQEIGPEVDRLALQLGCEPTDIQQRCHPYLGDPHGPNDVRWGAGALFRSDIMVQRRRVSPASLAESDHHRANWMNLLLPFCPESLELLVDQCSSCGKPLGWRRAWGIGHCDDWKCRNAIEPNSGERLPTSLVDGYRQFARIVSPVPEIREAAVATLHPDLAALPPAVLLNIILQLGATLSTPRIRFHRGTVQQLPPLTLAAVTARGAELVAEWPTRFRHAVAEEVGRLRLSRKSRQKPLLEAVRKLGLRPRPEQLRVIRNAIPEAFEHSGIALGSLLKPVVNGATACRMAAINPSDLRQLRQANLLQHQVLGDEERVCAQYDLQEIQDFANRKRSSEFASRLEQRLGIPRYASEQLAWLGEVEHEDHPCIFHLDHRLRFRSDSARSLIADLQKCALPGTAPADAMKLGTAMKRIGGRLKPWGAVLGAMRRDSIPFWVAAGRSFSRSAHVLLEDIEQFLDVEIQVGVRPCLHIAEEMTQIDAHDVLNLDPLQIRRVIATGELSFRPSGVAVVTQRPAVVALAKRSIATAEIALRLRMNFPGVPRMMARHPTVRRCAVGWFREDFEATFGSQPN